MAEMKLQELKNKTPTDLLAFAESLEVENASTMRKQELMFAILKQLASNEVEIIGVSVDRRQHEQKWELRTLCYPPLYAGAR